MARKINYFARNFVDSRTELINFVRQYYPDILNDFNDSSVGADEFGYLVLKKEEL